MAACVLPLLRVLAILRSLSVCLYSFSKMDSLSENVTYANINTNTHSALVAREAHWQELLRDLWKTPSGVGSLLALATVPPRHNCHICNRHDRWSYGASLALTARALASSHSCASSHLTDTSCAP